MGDRDRYQSYSDRDENRYREDPSRDRANEWRSQSRDRDWNSGRDYGRDYGRENSPGYNRDYGRDTERQFGSQYPERNYGQSYAGYESRRFPSTFGSSEDQRYGRDWNRDRTNESERNYGYGSDFGYGQQSRGDYRGREREEGFGQQLRETGQRVMGKIKRAFRGTKGYKRSDDRIREDVNDRLSLQEQLDPSEIEVAVSNGEVTLTGSVTTRREKFLAEEISDDVSGVSEVNNQLRVGRATQASPSDTTSSYGTQSGTEASRARNARAQ
jgi:osmotically-inducible protein OsmY